MYVELLKTLVEVNKNHLRELEGEELEKEMEILKNQCKLGEELGFTRQEIVDISRYSCLKA